MRHPGVDDDGVGRPVGAESEPVSFDDCRLWPARSEILLGSGGQGRIDLDRSDPSGAANDFGENAAVVASPGADMDDMVAMAQAQLVVHTGPKAGLPVVEPACLVDRDQHVL